MAKRISRIKVIRIEIDIEFNKPIAGRLLIPFFWIYCIKLVKAKVFGKTVYLICIPKFYYV